MKKSTVLIFLAIILLAGAFLRFYKLGEISFTADEFLDINASYGYSRTGEWHAWDFNLGQPAERVNDPSDRRAWIYRWQVARLFEFLPPTEAVARAVSALWGILTIPLIFFVGWRFSGKKEIGLIAAFLFAVSIVGIGFDRRLRMYAMFFPVFLAFSWTFFNFFENKYAGKMPICRWVGDKSGVNLMYALPALALGLLSFHLHQLTANLAAVFGIYVLILLWLGYKQEKKYINKYSYLLVAGSAVLAAAGIFFSETVNLALGTLKFFQDNYAYFSEIFVDCSHPLIATAFLALGIRYLYKIQDRKKEAVWLAASVIVPLLMAVFLWRRNAGPQYIFFIQSFEIILIAAGIYHAAEFFRNKLVQYKSKAFYVTLALSLLVLPDYGYFFQENNAYRQTSASENPDYRSVFGYFKRHRSPADVLITRDFRNYYWSGQKVETIDFGGELSKEKLTIGTVREAEKNSPSGWVIFADNDESYISKEAEEYMKKNLTKINDIAVRGKISVYRWGGE